MSSHQGKRSISPPLESGLGCVTLSNVTGNVAKKLLLKLNYNWIYNILLISLQSFYLLRLALLLKNPGSRPHEWVQVASLLGVKVAPVIPADTVPTPDPEAETILGHPVLAEPAQPTLPSLPTESWENNKNCFSSCWAWGSLLHSKS